MACLTGKAEWQGASHARSEERTFQVERTTAAPAMRDELGVTVGQTGGRCAWNVESARWWVVRGNSKVRRRVTQGEGSAAVLFVRRSRAGLPRGVLS